MPRLNRVDPWGDLHAVAERGLLTGNRGCLVDDELNVRRHHAAQLWISCLTSFRGWRQPLAAPHRWTPLFFLDDAVALAAGHRPCATCRPEAYRSYRDSVSASRSVAQPLKAFELDRLLVGERHRRGRGLSRAADRLTWQADASSLPDGVVLLIDRQPHVIAGAVTQPFSFAGWGPSIRRLEGPVDVLTPPTSTAALAHGFVPLLHPTAAEQPDSA